MRAMSDCTRGANVGGIVPSGGASTSRSSVCSTLDGSTVRAWATRRIWASNSSRYAHQMSFTRNPALGDADAAGRLAGGPGQLKSRFVPGCLQWLDDVETHVYASFVLTDICLNELGVNE